MNNGQTDESPRSKKRRGFSETQTRKRLTSLIGHLGKELSDEVYANKLGVIEAVKLLKELSAALNNIRGRPEKTTGVPIEEPEEESPLFDLEAELAKIRES